MRDIFLFVVILGAVPLMLWRPYIGIVYWTWLGLMNPHRLAYGAAHDFQFAQIVGGATILGLLFTKDERRWKSSPEVYLLLALVLWMSVTTIFALQPDLAVPQWTRVLKVQVMTFVMLMVLNTERQLKFMVWVLALSIGYYGIKGGVFTVATGGNYRVWGPEGSFVEDNNAIALATVMIIPLLYHLMTQSESRWVKAGLAGSMVLCAISVLGSHSRGALLAIGAMSLFMWLHSRSKIRLGLAIAVIAPVLIMMMPSEWDDRMKTISTYEEDSSAMGRVHTWTMLFRIANDRFMGAGFEPYVPEVFQKYIPEFPEVHAAHSIYFQVLGEHGWVGFLLFLLMWLFVWRSCRWIRRTAKDGPEWLWAQSISSAIQVSFIGYLVGGAFLNMAYWDLPYYEIAMIVSIRSLMSRAAAGASAAPAAGAEKLPDGAWSP